MKGQESPLDSQEIISVVDRDDPRTISAEISRLLNPLGIRARIAWKNAYLGILLEAAVIPDRDRAIDLIKGYFAKLDLESIRAVKIYGREVGQMTPAWFEEIQIKKAIPSDSSSVSLAEWLSQGADVDSSDNFVDFEDLLRGDKDKFLHFHFNLEDTALFFLNKVKEVLNISIGDILPVPHMPDLLLGIYHCRGEILWLVDLGQQLGFTPSIDSLAAFQTKEGVVFPSNSDSLSFTNTLTLPKHHSTLTAIVIQDGEKFIGIVVPKVIDIEMHNLQHMHSPSAELFSPRILPFIQGYLTDTNTPILDVKALIEDPQLQMYSY
ncbi:MAG: chemotaxis protein CheW [Prochloraceae cyanobacterium]